MGVSMTTLMTTAAMPGDRVMITGAGPVGFLAAQVFALSGYDVLVAEPDAVRRRQVERSGIRSVFAKTPFEDASIAGTVALGVECSGHEQAVLDACRVVRKRGKWSWSASLGVARRMPMPMNCYLSCSTSTSYCAADVPMKAGTQSTSRGRPAMATGSPAGASTRTRSSRPACA